MALCAMVVYDPPGEPRTDLMVNSIASVLATIHRERHRMFVVSNALCAESHRALVHQFGCGSFQLIETGSNIGTARGINRAWQLRNPGEHCLKIDSDVTIAEPGWLDKLEECIGRDPTIGQVGLKRPDLIESPHNAAGWSKSELVMLPHKPGEKWLCVEKVHHVMGNCVLHSSALLDKVGYLYQMGAAYGFDDGDMSARCYAAGFYSCFYPHYYLSHPDPGLGNYQKWKEHQAAVYMDRFLETRKKYQTGELPLYRGPADE